MPPTIVRNPSADKYNKDSESNRHMPMGKWRYSDSVIPGHTAGGIVSGINPHAAEQLQAVIDPKPEPNGVSGYTLHVTGYTPEEHMKANEIAEQQVPPDVTGIERIRMVAFLKLELLARLQNEAMAAAEAANAKVASQAKLVSNVTTESPKMVVTYDIPSFGVIPVEYDSAVIDGKQLIVGVDHRRADSTYFPNKSITQPIGVTVSGKTYIAHVTGIKYTLDGKTCAVLLLED